MIIIVQHNLNFQEKAILGCDRLNLVIALMGECVIKVAHKTKQKNRTCGLTPKNNRVTTEPINNMFGVILKKN